MVRITLQAALAAFLAAPAAAQDDPYDPLKRNVEAFAGLLEQALELEPNRGLFGFGGERIDSMYLAGHGLVLEVRSNLAGARSQLDLAVLNNSVMALRQGGNPFAMLAQPTGEEADSAAQLTEEDERNPQFESLLRMRDIDSEAVSSAISQAGEYARILRDADGVDGDAFAQLRLEIEGLQRENRAGVERLRELTEELHASAAEQDEQLEQMLGEISAEMERLQERAEAMADGLREQSERAQAERAARWREDVASLESKLIDAMCEYGASLRELPANENITVILNGLGDESSKGGGADLIHTFSKPDLLLCSGGDIDTATLGELSGRYSY